MEDFPDEILLLICKYLDVRSLCALMLTSVRWLELLQDESLISRFRINKISVQKNINAHIKNGELCMRMLPEFLMDVHGKIVHKVLSCYEFILILTEDKHLYFWGPTTQYMVERLWGKTRQFKGEYTASGFELDMRGIRHPLLLSEKKFVDVCIGDIISYPARCIEDIVTVGVGQTCYPVAAISQDGDFYFWRREECHKIRLKDQRACKCFFVPYICGFVSSDNLIYLSNYDHFVIFPKTPEEFLIVDWRDHINFKIKTVVYWKFNNKACVISKCNTLYTIDIGCQGEIKGKDVAKIIDNVVKAKLIDMYIFILQTDGTILRTSPKTYVCHRLYYDKKYVDMDVAKFSDGKYRLDAITADGTISHFVES